MTLAYPSPALRDDSVHLRPWEPADLACVQAASHHPETHPFTTVPHTDDPAEALAYIVRQNTRAELGEGWSLAVTDAATGTAVGQAFLGVRPQPGVYGLGYWLLPEARGAGRGRRAVRLLTQWAFEDLDAARVEAWVEPHNVASQRLLEACGFSREGGLRSFLDLGDRRTDVIIFSRLPSDAAGPAPS